jgi:hypothetical protein
LSPGGNGHHLFAVEGRAQPRPPTPERC